MGSGGYTIIAFPTSVATITATDIGAGTATVTAAPGEKGVGTGNVHTGSSSSSHDATKSIIPIFWVVIVICNDGLNIELLYCLLGKIRQQR